MSNVVEIWHVKLATGEVLSVDVDGLDTMFQAGKVDEDTAVLPPGAIEWRRLRDVAGLDDDTDTPAPVSTVNAPSLAPVALSTSESSVAAMGGDTSLPELEDEHVDLRPKRTGLFVGIGIVALLIGGLALGVTKFGVGAGVPSAAAAGGDPSRLRAKLAPDTPDTVSPIPRPLTEEQRRALLEADKKRDADRAAKHKTTAPQPHAAPQQKASDPIRKGGSKYDPLNGSL